jgi:hypothetical protein
MPPGINFSLGSAGDNIVARYIEMKQRGKKERWQSDLNNIRPDKAAP